MLKPVLRCDNALHKFWAGLPLPDRWQRPFPHFLFSTEFYFIHLFCILCFCTFLLFFNPNVNILSQVNLIIHDSGHLSICLPRVCFPGHLCTEAASFLSWFVGGATASLHEAVGAFPGMSLFWSVGCLRFCTSMIHFCTLFILIVLL